MNNDEWCLFDGEAERYEYEVMRELYEEEVKSGVKMSEEFILEERKEAEMMSEEFNCAECGDAIDVPRAKAGYVVCKECGESAALSARKKWTVVQEYGKGGYQFVTPESAATTLKQTNQKQPRD